MNEQYINEYRQGFMDKCASAGLTQEQSDELYKQAYLGAAKAFGQGLWRVGKNLFKGGNKGKWARQTATNKAKGVGKFVGGQAVGMAPFLAYDYFTGGNGQPQQQPGAAGPQGPQLPQRGYGQAKLNVRGMGGITPYLT
jgi:hypothetical protein